MPKSARVSKVAQNGQQNIVSSNGTVGDSIGGRGVNLSSYEETQKDEIEVLKAIYDENFSDVKTKSAWSKTTEKSFRLKLAAYSDESVNVVLLVTLTATYPNTLPILNIVESNNVVDKCLAHVHEIVATKPRQMVREVMIHEIATAIQDVLEDFATAQAEKQAQNAQVPSLEEERTNREARVAKAALEQQEIAAKRETAAQAEEERKARELVDEEMRRRVEVRMRRKTEAPDDTFRETHISTVSFDQHITYRDDDGLERSFRIVSLLPSSDRGVVSTLSYAIPMLTDHSMISTLAMKQVAIPHSQAKRSMLDLESLLEKLRGLRHENIVNVLGFRVENESLCWNFDILVERAMGGSLVDMLAAVDFIPTNKVRLWGIEILQGVDFLHRNGIMHGRLHAGNVLFHRNSSGVIAPKLSDGGFEDYLHSLAPQAKLTQPEPFPRWIAPESSNGNTTEKTPKTDMWDFGTIVVQMLLGIQICDSYPTPDNFRRSMELSDPFDDLLRDLFRRDPKSRPNAFDVIPYEFFRVEAPALQSAASLTSSAKPRLGPVTPLSRRLRHESSGGMTASSRYDAEWDEVARLGKGGYGEVVKSRNKLDGRVYAIKKIVHNTPAELSQVLSEVHLLATLNHPYVVRYYTAWPEDETSAMEESSEELTSSSGAFLTAAADGSSSLSFDQSGRGLDFISSSGYPKIEFGYDDDVDEEAISDGDSSSGSESSSIVASASEKARRPADQLALRSRRLSSRPATKSTLYIQMELCERLTLRDIIRKGLSNNNEEIWRIFRAVLEGLVHIHSHGIIHRDLKPENIFIDAVNNPRIGDFGLATSGNFSRPDRGVHSLENDGDMTNNVGTTFYVAPELQAHGTSSYTGKIDMYSLGIIFFEMCYPLSTGMERMHTLSAIRQKDFVLPKIFQTPEKALQGELIYNLLSQRPSSRPTSAELLRSGKLPVQIEDETVLLALKGLADESNPYHHKMMTALFTKGPDHNIRAQMWDFSDKEAGQSPSVEFMLLQATVKEKIEACFRRHGAVETSRQGPFPQSEYYENKDAFQLLDASGTLVQLPYDLTLPLARKVARQAKIPEKTYAFGTVWRDALNNGAPRSTREVDFDIITHDAKDNALKEAEVIKVMDELLDEIPALSSAQMCFHVSHSELLGKILSFCRIGEHQRTIVTETLVRLNIQGWTWQKIRNELRSASSGVPSTSLDELARFDFRDTPEKTLSRLQTIFAGSDAISCLHEVFTHISGLVEYCKRLGVKRKIYISPLSSFNHRFYTGGIMFQCLFDAKKRDVLAAGGRYDSLIEAHRPHNTGSDIPQRAHGVGINIAWDRIITSMVRHQSRSSNASSFLKKNEDAPTESWTLRRCDVLVTSFDPSILRSTGVRLVAELWAHDISAELAGDTSTSEEPLSRHRSDNHSWIIQIKHDSSGTTNMTARADLKVKSVDKKEDFDVRSWELVQFLRAEIREREHREGTYDRFRPARPQSHSGPGASSGAGEVSVLMGSLKSKKGNKMRLVESAREAAQELLGRSAGAPIAAIETRDEILEKIRDTRLSDAESWRRAIQEVPPNERNYMREVQDEIERLKRVYSETCRSCFLYNFRTGSCLLYDMGL